MLSLQHMLPDRSEAYDAYNEKYADACHRFGLELDCGDHVITYEQAAEYLDLSVSSIAAYSSRLFTPCKESGVVSLSDVVVYSMTRHKKRRR